MTDIVEKIKISPASLNDKRFIAKAHEEIVNVSKQKQKPSRWVSRDILCRNPKAKVLVARRGKVSVGLLLYSLTYFAGDGAVLWVSQLYVERKYRGKGVVRKLLEEAKKRHPEALGLFWATSPDNKRAFRYFELMGAKALKDFTLFYRDWKGL